MHGHHDRVHGITGFSFSASRGDLAQEDFLECASNRMHGEESCLGCVHAADDAGDTGFVVDKN